ncbi:MAG TPA: hypothetical protein VF157_13320, partial [Chloroflexota bacterium]
LRQQRKYLSERSEQLKRLAETQLKEQRECSDAPARSSQLRKDVAALRDPRAHRHALLQTAARKQAVEGELRQVQRNLSQAEKRRDELAQRVADLTACQETLGIQRRRTEETHEAYCMYRAQQAIADLAANADPELAAASSELEVQNRLQEQAEARATALAASIRPLEDAPARAAALRARMEEAETRAADWKERYQVAADELAAGEQNRIELGKAQAALTLHQRAHALLVASPATFEEAEGRLATRLRNELARAATERLHFLLDDEEAAFAWQQGQAPALVKAGATRQLDELGPLERYCCALAWRLALAADSSRFGAVFVSGLGPLQQSEPIIRKLQRLPFLDQLVVTSAW